MSDRNVPTTPIQQATKSAKRLREKEHFSSDEIANIPKFGKVIPNRIFVGGIDYDTREEDLETYFSSFGKVVHTKIVKDRADISKGFGFVTFEKCEDASKVKNKDIVHVLKGKKLNVGAAVEKLQTNFPKDVHLPVSPGSWIVHPGGYTSYTHQNGITYFPPALPLMTTPPPQFYGLKPFQHASGNHQACSIVGPANAPFVYTPPSEQPYSVLTQPQVANTPQEQTRPQILSPRIYYSFNHFHFPCQIPQQTCKGFAQTQQNMAPPRIVVPTKPYYVYPQVQGESPLLYPVSPTCMYSSPNSPSLLPCALIQNPKMNPVNHFYGAGTFVSDSSLPLSEQVQTGQQPTPSNTPEQKL